MLTVLLIVDPDVHPLRSFLHFQMMFLRSNLYTTPNYDANNVLGFLFLLHFVLIAAITMKLCGALILLPHTHQHSKFYSLSKDMGQCHKTTRKLFFFFSISTNFVCPKDLSHRKPSNAPEGLCPAANKKAPIMHFILVLLLAPTTMLRSRSLHPKGNSVLQPWCSSERNEKGDIFFLSSDNFLSVSLFYGHIFQTKADIQLDGFGWRSSCSAEQFALCVCV